MPAWIAGIHQVRKDASGNIRVSLDSSTPCWNDAIEKALPETIEVLPPVFSKAGHERLRYVDYKLRALCTAMPKRRRGRL